MSNTETLAKTIPPKEMPFVFEAEGSITKKRYTGDFIVKVPTLRDLSRLGVELARLNCGIPFEELDKYTQFLNNAMAFIKVCIISGPEWYKKIDELEDANVAVELYDKAQGLVSAWKDSVSGVKND